MKAPRKKTVELAKSIFNKGGKPQRTPRNGTSQKLDWREMQGHILCAGQISPRNQRQNSVRGSKALDPKGNLKCSGMIFGESVIFGHGEIRRESPALHVSGSRNPPGKGNTAKAKQIAWFTLRKKRREGGNLRRFGGKKAVCVGIRLSSDVTETYRGVPAEHSSGSGKRSATRGGGGDTDSEDVCLSYKDQSLKKNYTCGGRGGGRKNWKEEERNIETDFGGRREFENLLQGT